LEQGLTKAAIARKLGLNPRTIYRWIETNQLDRDLDEEAARYGPRPPVARKIDPYRALIKTRLEAYSKLSAVRLFEEIQAAGYDGSYTQVKEFVRSIRPQPEPEPVVRFETPPGHQAQVDFGEFRFPWGKRFALLVVLGYSRLLWLSFYERQTMEVLCDGLETAFTFFGGVPRELLFDQMKAVIVDDQRLKGGQLFENEEFLRFANHWGFRIRACRPYRAKTKGKVERPIRYVRENFIYGREFVNDGDLDDQAMTWLAKANRRVHGTTNEVPIERFERGERLVLQSLAARPYRSLVRPDPRPTKPMIARGLPSVERRALERYAELAEVTS
jgi:transposase